MDDDDEYLEGEFNKFLQPYRFGRAFGTDDITGFNQPLSASEIDVPTFQQYVRGLGTPQSAREQARSVFSNVVNDHLTDEAMVDTTKATKEVVEDDNDTDETDTK